MAADLRVLLGVAFAELLALGDADLLDAVIALGCWIGSASVHLRRCLVWMDLRAAYLDWT